MKQAFALVVLAFFFSREVRAARPSAPENRVASIFISQDFINEQLALHSKSELFKDAKIVLDAEQGRMLLQGKILVPTEELRAINLDPKFGVFQFQMAIKPEVTREGHLILDFPLSETFFYPAISKDPLHERVIVPVQMLSIALASARGYLAALSGDFSGFDRRTEKLTALIKSLNRSIAAEKNTDARDELENQRAALKLQLDAVPIERKQLMGFAKQFAGILGFTGEKELNINNDLGARKNALILKLKLSQLTPFLTGVELGGVRVVFDKKDGAGQNYLAVDVNSALANRPRMQAPATGAVRAAGAKVAPAIIMRLHESLFESEELVEMEKKEMGSSLRNMEYHLRDDGLHVSGEWHKLFLSVPFETTVDFASTGTDTFEVRARQLDVAGIDVEFLTKYVLETLKRRLDITLKGACTFKYVGEESDHSRALQVTVLPQALVPAFPDLHLVDVDIREREFLLKIGRP